MRNPVVIFLVLILAGVGGVLYFLFSNTSPGLPGTERAQVFVTIPPLSDLVTELMGDLADVSVLVPPGASPHTYEPTPGQLRAIAQADVLVKVGTPIEFELVWLDRLQQVNPDLRVIDLSQGITLREYEEDDEHEEEDEDNGHQGADPHIWLSPENLRTMARTLAAELEELFPDAADLLAVNQGLLDGKITGIDRQIRETLKGREGETILTYHDSWGYFGDEYGLRIISVEVEGKEITAQTIASIVGIARDENIRVIFGSPEFPTQSVQTIAEQIGGEVILVSPLPEHILDELVMIADAFALNK